jgi:hypothetical protein
MNTNFLLFSWIMKLSKIKFLFMVYSAALLVTQNVWRRVIGLLMNNGWAMASKKVFVASFEILSQCYLGGTKEIHGKYCQFSQCSGPDSKGENSEHRSEIGFEVFTAVVMKSIIFWDMTSCSLSSCNRRFGGKCRLHLQGWRNNFSKNQQASRWKAE